MGLTEIGTERERKEIKIVPTAAWLKGPLALANVDFVLTFVS